MDWFYFIIWLGLLLFFIKVVGLWLDRMQRGVVNLFAKPKLQDRIRILQNKNDNLADQIEQGDHSFFTREKIKHG